MTNSLISQISIESASKSTVSGSRIGQVFSRLAYGPPASYGARATQIFSQAAVSTGANNVAGRISQVAVMAAYQSNNPAINRQTAWTFVMDGHRFYVLPLQREGDWAYDTTTQEWCQLQTQGFDGLNFTNGVMWGIRVIGGDSLFPYLYELDPNQPLDEGWRSVQHIVTGGVPLRDRYTVGVSNFSLTVSQGTTQGAGQPVSMAFSDDNGVTYSKDFTMTMTTDPSQQFLWNALGSYTNPGRIFRVTDTAGALRIDDATCVLVVPSGTDSGEGD